MWPDCTRRRRFVAFGARPSCNGGVLEVRDLSFSYGAHVAVHDVSFTIGAGEVLGCLGPNGSGKSTTVKMLAGLLAPETGQIRFRGHDAHDDLLGYKAAIGYVPEDGGLYAFLTPDEYLRLAGGLRGVPATTLDRRIERLLRAWDLEAYAGARLSTLSKGMRQKVLLSAALLHDPQVVILDEPASGLDVTAMLTLRELVAGLAARQRVVFFSSHELDLVRQVSTQVLILSEGRVAAQGSVEQLQALAERDTLEEAFAELSGKHGAVETAEALLEGMGA